MILPILIRVQGHSLFPGLLSARGCIFDLGANVGSFSKTVHEMFGARCVAVEANPSLVAEMRRAHPRLNIIHRSH